MLGAIAGDVIGSVHERARTKTKEFPLFVPESTFTDDTVLTVAVAESLLRPRDYVDALHDFFHAYPTVGYGPTFYRWCICEARVPYNSWGNGSAMRVSAVAYARDTLDDVLAEAKRSAEVTHTVSPRRLRRRSRSENEPAFDKTLKKFKRKISKNFHLACSTKAFLRFFVYD